MRTFVSILALAATMGMAAPAHAWDAGDWLVRFGASNVDPKSDNGSLNLSVVDPALSPSAEINVEDAWSATFNFTYMYSPNLGIELLAAWPFQHDIKVESLGKVAEVTHLPPTLSLQYHFLPDSAFQPYLGAGANLTYFYDEEAKGTLKDLGGSISIDSTSFGLAVQAGFDYLIGEQWFVNVDVRWIDINVDADVTVPGVGTLTTEVEIDPIVYGLHVGYRF